MIKISYKSTFTLPDRDFLQKPSEVFADLFDYSLLSTPLCRRIIKHIDNCTVIKGNRIKSTVFGKIPPEKLSGGCKNVLLALSGDYIHYSIKLGDNCFEPLTWIIEEYPEKDIYIRCVNLMPIGTNLYKKNIFYSIEENRLIRDYHDALDLMYRYNDTGYFESV